MAAVHPIEVLEKRLRDLLEAYESDLGDAVDRVTERFSGRIERLVEQFGAEELEINLKYYPITVLPETCTKPSVLSQPSGRTRSRDRGNEGFEGNAKGRHARTPADRFSPRSRR